MIGRPASAVGANYEKHKHTRTHTHTRSYLDDLKLGDVDHDGRDLAAVVALEGLGHRRSEGAGGPIVHLSLLGRGRGGRGSRDENGDACILQKISKASTKD